MRTLIRGLFALALVAAPAAFAQQAPLAPAQAPAAAAAPPPAPVAESHVAAAREVIIGSGLSRSLDAIVPQIADQIRAGVSRQRPEIIKDMEEAFRVVIPELTRGNDQIITVAARLFAQRMSEAELKDVAVFFKSTSGAKYVQAQPVLLNELFAEMQVYSQTLGNLMMDRMREEMKKKNIDF
jgi:uncharacterized protein